MIMGKMLQWLRLAQVGHGVHHHLNYSRIQIGQLRMDHHQILGISHVMPQHLVQIIHLLPQTQMDRQVILEACSSSCLRTFPRCHILPYTKLSYSLDLPFYRIGLVGLYSSCLARSQAQYLGTFVTRYDLTSQIILTISLELLLQPVYDMTLSLKYFSFLLCSDCKLAQTQPYGDGRIHSPWLPCTIHVPINASYCMGGGKLAFQLDNKIRHLYLVYLMRNLCDVNTA